MEKIIELMPSLTMVAVAISGLLVVAVPRKLPFAIPLMAVILSISSFLLSRFSQDRIAMIIFSVLVAILHPAFRWAAGKSSKNKGNKGLFTNLLTRRRNECASK